MAKRTTRLHKASSVRIRFTARAAAPSPLKSASIQTRSAVEKTRAATDGNCRRFCLLCEFKMPVCDVSCRPDPLVAATQKVGRHAICPKGALIKAVTCKAAGAAGERPAAAVALRLRCTRRDPAAPVPSLCAPSGRGDGRPFPESPLSWRSGRLGRDGRPVESSFRPESRLRC